MVAGRIVVPFHGMGSANAPGPPWQHRFSQLTPSEEISDYGWMVGKQEVIPFFPAA
jgi:hypothetical protein